MRRVVPKERQGTARKVQPLHQNTPASLHPHDRPLRCVSSGYLGDGCSCDASVPGRVVAAAWARELAQGGVRRDRFFQFCWRGRDWLAFGLGTGEIRGVYCPTHSAERAARHSALQSEDGRGLAIAI